MCCFFAATHSCYMVSLVHWVGTSGGALCPGCTPKACSPSTTSHCPGLVTSLQHISCRHQCPQILCVHPTDKIFHKLIWFEGHNLEDFIYLCLLCRDLYPYLSCNSLFLYSSEVALNYRPYRLLIHLIVCRL